MNLEHRQKSSGRWVIWSIITVLVIIILMRTYIKNSNTSSVSTSKSNRELVDSCTTDMATEFHIHPFLDITINGQKQVIPANVGIFEGCMHPLHTHDETGKIHVESPVQRDFTLGDFFYVWKKTFTKDQILDYTADSTHTIRQTINGEEVQDFENTILRDGDRINIFYEEKK